MNYSAGGPNKILLHYTQGTSNGIEAFPIGSRFPAHFIVDLVKKEGFQLLSVDRGSVASVSADNTTVQIEIVGFGHSSEAGYTPEYDLQKFGNAEWDYLAILINAIASQYHIPTTTPVSWEGANVRVKSQSEFDKMTGIVGHMHAPGDDHDDPGNIWPQVSAALARNPIANTTGINLVDTCRVSTLYGTSGLIATTPTTAGENLTQDQIEAIINYYKTQADAEASAGKWMMPIQDSGIWNCFSLSAWWIQTLTTIGRADVTQWGSGGKDLAHAVAQIYHLEESNTPRPYAVFSVGRTQDAPGHTGIVVAVDGDEVTFIEASYGDEGYTDKRTESLSSGYFNNIVSPYAFTYLDSVMDINALNAVLGASASTAGKSS